MNQEIHTVAYGSEQLPLKIDSITLSCYILENNQRVITKNSIQKALGYEGKSDEWLADLLASIHKFSPIENEILNFNKNLVLFEEKRDGLNVIIQSVTSLLFLAICKTIVTAKNDGYLNVNQLKFAKNGEAILEILHIENINYSIDQATGFVFYKENAKEFLQQFLSKTLNESSFVWIKTLPESFFESVFYLHQLDWIDLKKKPTVVGKIIFEIVFSRLSDKQLKELRETKPKRNYKSKGTLSQKNEHPTLKEYIATLQSLLKAAGYQWTVFLQLLNRTHIKNENFRVSFTSLVEKQTQENEELSFFNKNLVKGVLVTKKFKNKRLSN